MKILLFIGVLFVSSLATASSEVVSSGVIGHSGGTDRQGCHVNSRTGIRHCH